MIAEKNTHISIKSLALDDRPREKLYLKGSNTLSDAELLAIVIGSGTRKETAVQLAQKILQHHSFSFEDLARTNIEELKTFKGIGQAKAISIMACLEISRRRKPNGQLLEKPKLVTSRMLYETIAPLLLDKPKEHFYILYLNHQLRLIKTEMLSIGTDTSTFVDVRVIAKEALKFGAKNFAIAHNHPSGNTNPSKQDQLITAKIKSALALFDINLIDHIIVGNQTYYSFADENNL